jgi:hypothetical protein
MSVLGAKLFPAGTELASDLDAVLSASYFDPKSQTNHYVRQDLSGQRFTIKITNYEFDRDCGPLTDEAGRARRRAYLNGRLLRAKADNEAAATGVIGFSPVAERNCGLDVSPIRLEAYLNDMATKISILTRQVNDLTRTAKLED